MPFDWQVTHDLKFRFLLYGLSLATVVIAIVYMILGFVSFSTYFSWTNGSFVGGWITSVCIFYAIMALTAMLGMRLNNIPLLICFFVYNVASLLVRVLTVILFSVHSLHIDWTSWVLGGSEVLFALASFSIMTVIVETGGISPSHRSATTTKRTTTKRTATAATTSASGAGGGGSKSGVRNGIDVEANASAKPSNPFESPTESTEILRY